jgi:hypothetical protein
MVSEYFHSYILNIEYHSMYCNSSALVASTSLLLTSVDGDSIADYFMLSDACTLLLAQSCTLLCPHGNFNLLSVSIVHVHTVMLVLRAESLSYY